MPPVRGVEGVRRDGVVFSPSGATLVTVAVRTSTVAIALRLLQRHPRGAAVPRDGHVLGLEVLCGGGPGRRSAPPPRAGHRR